jgi:unsaturated rhamnogalacturonyl hydrolase
LTQLSNDPLQMAHRLAQVYGHKLEVPVVYTQGVALSGRLRLHELADSGAPGDDPSSDIENIVAPRLAEGTAMFGEAGGTANFAGICWADELYKSTGKQSYLDVLIEMADRYESPRVGAPIAPPLDTDIRVEDFFFAATMLGRAFKQTGNERYLDVLVTFLLAADTQQADGLWWHCKESPFYWGRGNGFAAMGFAETLTYLPADHPQRERLVASHVRHIEGLAAFQDESGMWRQVIDREDSYLEHSATSMIGYVLARGLRLGWLGGRWRSVAERAWSGAADRIGPNCELEHVCGGTGPQPDVKSYLERPYSDGLDDRGGSMALWFAVEMARLGTGL